MPSVTEHARLRPGKSLSYLPCHTIRYIYGLRLKHYVAWAESFGNCRMLTPPWACRIGSGALYADHPENLPRDLRDHAALLHAHGWPGEPVAFIRRVAREWCDNSHPVAALIHHTFGDIYAPLVPPGQY